MRERKFTQYSTEGKKHGKLVFDKDLSIFVCREAKEKEQAQKALKEKEEETPEPEEITNEESSSAPAVEANNEEDQTKAAVVLQSNFRGYKERKKFNERKKTMAGAELELPPNAVVEQEGGQELAGKEEEGVKTADKTENDDDEESTYEAEENDDSDHTQVPEDEEHTDEAVIEDALAADAGKEGQEEDKKEENGQEKAAGEEAVNIEEETKAATVIQSNFRGHKERKRLQDEGKIPAKKQKAKSPSGEEAVPTESSPTGEEKVPAGQTPAEESGNVATEKEEESPKAQDAADVSSGDVQSEGQDQAKAAVVIQSNFRGHKERKRLEEEGKIPKKKKKEREITPEPPKEEEQVTQTEESGPESQPDASAEGLDEEKAATVLQSNFRGHRDRKKLKAERETQNKTKEEAANDAEEETKDVDEALDATDVMIEREEETDAEKERLEEEQAAVKIQSNFRGYKDRKNLKANKQTAQTEAAQLESFSKEVITLKVL